MRISSIIIVIFRNIKITLLKLLGKSSSIVPYKLLIGLTNRCNSRCRFCHIWKIGTASPALLKNELTLEELTDLFRQMGRNLVWLALTGGEITLVPHYKQMLREAAKYCPSLRIVTFTTNGLNSDRIVEYAEFTRDMGFDCFVNISLDGDEKLHDSLRGVPGNYRKCMLTHGRLGHMGIHRHYSITVSPGNLAFIRERYKDLAPGIKAATFVHGGGIYNRQNRIDHGALNRGMERIVRGYRVESPGEFIEFIYLKIACLFLKQGMEENLVPCEVVTTNLHITADGGVNACMFMPPLGNIRALPLGEILGSKHTRATVKRIGKGNCPGCWMNCYAPHSIMHHPLKSLLLMFK